MAMGAYSEKMLSEELELEAKEAAITKYAEMFLCSDGNCTKFRNHVMSENARYSGELPKVHLHR